MITNTINASGWQMLCSVHTFYFEHIGMQHAHNMHSSFLVESMVMACVFPSSLQTLRLPSTMLGLLLMFVMSCTHCSRAVAILDVTYKMIAAFFSLLCCRLQQSPGIENLFCCLSGDLDRRASHKW